MEEDRESLTLSIAEVFNRCGTIESLCAAWLNGELGSEETRVQLSNLRNQNVIIAELNGKPEDFDWALVDKDVIDSGEKAHETYLAAIKVIDCVLKAIELHEQKAKTHRLRSIAKASDSLGIQLPKIARYRIQIHEAGNPRPG